MRKWPTFVQGIALVLCGILLAVGGCVGYLMNAETNPMGMIGGVAFFAGIVMLMVGIVLFVAGVFKGLFGLVKPKEE